MTMTIESPDRRKEVLTEDAAWSAIKNCVLTAKLPKGRYRATAHFIAKGRLYERHFGKGAIA